MSKFKPQKVEYRDSKGLLHNSSGPALIMPNGDKYWFKHGKRHREDGPAVEWHDGRVEYHYEGLFTNKDELEILKKRSVNVETSLELLSQKFKVSVGK